MSLFSCARRLRFVSAVALAMVVCGSARGQGGVKIEQNVSYLDTPHNIRINNGTVELILTTDYGPRIMRYAPVGSGDDDNVFATIPGVTLKTDLGDWYIRGGHRMWEAPENLPGSYEPDNGPIKAEILPNNTVKLTEPVEKTTHIQKEMWITLDAQGSHVTVVHRLTNKGRSPVEMACWAMSAMNKNGTAILPQEPYASHDVSLQPVRPMVLWAYTNMADPRWMFGKNYLTLHQDPTNKESQKIGIQNRQGWAAYAHNGALFLKRFAYENDKSYPDYGCNNETYTNDVFLELETLGTLQKVKPGQTISHTEDWWLYTGVNPGSGEDGIAAALQPILAETTHK